MIGAGVLGLFLGALLFDFLTPFLGVLRSPSQSITLPDVLGVPYGSLAITIGLMFLLMIRVMDRIDPGKKFDSPAPMETPPLEKILRREWGWLPTGLVVGVLIYASSLLGQYMSVVAGFSTLLAHALAPFGWTLQSVPALSDATAWRSALVIGIFPGGFLSAWLAKSLAPEKPVTPVFQEAFGPRVSARIALVFLGGTFLSLGANIGGGCTTGALMSGWPTLSVGNLAMGMVFFGAGMATVWTMYWGKWSVVSTVKARGLSLATD
jgi:hypothetical protein